LLKRDNGEYNASDHYDRSNHARPQVTKSAVRLRGLAAGGGEPRGLLWPLDAGKGSLSGWAARNFILNILTLDLRKIASPRHSDLPERRIVDGLTVPAKTSANVPINSATHFFITLNKLLFVYPFCSPHRNDEVI